MAKCSIKLPDGQSPDELSSVLGTYIKQIGALGDSMLGMAVREFFEETSRWRYVSHNIELSCGDQQIDFDLPDGIKCRARAPIFMRYERCPHDQCDEIKVYARKDGAHADRDNVAFHECDKPLAFYQPENGKVIFSRPLEEDATFRVELVLWPATFDAIECVPEEIMSTYQEGIVSLAIVKAMEIPDKPWTKVSKTLRPAEIERFERKHYIKAMKHKKSAKNYHSNNVAEGRPFGDRFNSRISSDGRHSSRYHYGRRGRLHRF